MRTDLYNFLLSVKPLFWDIPLENLPSLSDEAIVERILEFGNTEEIKFVATFFQNSLPRIYNTLKSKRRSNLSPKSLAFLRNYIQYHPPRVDLQRVWEMADAVKLPRGLPADLSYRELIETAYE